MDKKYIIDIKKNKNDNDFILNVSNIGNLTTLDLDINSCLLSYKEALKKDDLEKASEILNVLKELTEYGDKRFSDTNIFFKAKEIILYFENMDNKNVIDSMNILLKIKGFFRFLNSQITFEYDNENSILIEEIKKIKNIINVKKLIDRGLYKNYNPSVKDLNIILEFKESFNDNEEYHDLENIYNFLKKKLNNQIKNLSINISKGYIETYKNIFNDKYHDSFYKGEEFKNLLSKNNIENYKEFSELLDKYYLLYQYNKGDVNKEKRIILMKLLLGNFINIPNIYRNIIIENIIKNKKQYIEISNFYDDVSRIIEIIEGEKRLNAIVI